MSVTRPSEWKGSDLRSRTEVVRYLREHGGEVTDQTGLVVGTMRTDLGKGRALSQLLADMEVDGMLEREVRGRRTFRVKLLDDWNLVPKVIPQHDAPVASDGSIDYDQMATALLAIVMKRAAAPPPAPPDTTLPDRLQWAETTLAEVTAERDQLRSRCDELSEQNRILTHNQGVLQSQLDKRPARKGATISELLDPESLAMLEQLQRELPSTRG